jgi:hypothetical protein
MIQIIQNLNLKKIIINFENNLSHKINIKKIVLIIEINNPINEIIFYNKNIFG